MQVPITFSHDILAEALALAKKGPLKLWARAVQMYQDREAPPLLALRAIAPDKQPFFYPLGYGKWVFTECATGNHLVINHHFISEGLKAIARSYPSVLVPLLGHERAVTGDDGDALIQCSVFGIWKYKPNPLTRETVRP